MSHLVTKSLNLPISKQGLTIAKLDPFMGAGFALMLPENFVPLVLTTAQQQAIPAWQAGYVRQQQPGKRVVIQPKHIEYTEEMLSISS